METRDLGFAIKHLKNGSRVYRSGWSCRDMWLACMPGYPNGIGINAVTAKASGLPEGSSQKFLPYVIMKTADGSFVPWLCSQSDLLAEDWMLVS